MSFTLLGNNLGPVQAGKIAPSPLAAIVVRSPVLLVSFITMKYCYTCKSEYPDTFLFCTRCGASFDVKYCRNLHANSREAEYCNVCGSSNLSSTDDRPKESRAGIIIGTAIVLCAIVGILFIVLSSFGETTIIRPRTVLLTAAFAAGAVVVWDTFRGGR